jgi:hypothetical protein
MADDDENGAKGRTNVNGVPFARVYRMREKAGQQQKPNTKTQESGEKHKTVKRVRFNPIVEIFYIPPRVAN